MTAEIIEFITDTPEHAADRAVMGQILDHVEKILAIGPIRRGEFVCVAHGAAIKARLRGDADAEQHFIQIAAELWAMQVDDIVECAVTRRSVLHDMIEECRNGKTLS
jgi:hypothetical protein